MKPDVQSFGILSLGRAAGSQNSSKDSLTLMVLLLYGNINTLEPITLLVYHYVDLTGQSFK